MTSLLLAATLAQGTAPKGFVAVTTEPAPAIRGVLDDDLPYVVTLIDGRVRIEAWMKKLRRERAEHAARGPDPKPPADAQRLKLGNITLRGFLQRGEGDLEVRDGWLIAYDFGEFGGGIVHVAREGRRATIIDRDNTFLVERMPGGIFGVQGLAHMGLNFGRLVRVFGPAPSGSGGKGGGGWHVVPVADLVRSPRAVVRDGERFVFLRDRSVTALATDGKRRELYRSRGDTGLSSLVRPGNGELWLGAYRAVLRLTPKPGGGYAPQWFAPVNATRTTRRG